MNLEKPFENIPFLVLDSESSKIGFLNPNAVGLFPKGFRLKKARALSYGLVSKIYPSSKSSSFCLLLELFLSSTSSINFPTFSPGFVT